MGEPNVTAGQIQLTYVGHSTVLVKTSEGKRIIIDPWLEGNPSCPKSLLDPGALDLICLTHGHGDHTGSAVELARRTKAPVIANFELGQLLIKDGVPPDQIPPMNKGGTIDLPSIPAGKVTLTQAFHSSSYDAKDGNTYYAGEPCGVVLSLPGGKKIYHAGDTLLFNDMSLIRERFAPDLACIPIGDRFTMGPEDAASAVALIDPQFVVPIHWGTFPLLSGEPSTFADLVSKKQTRSKVVVLEPGQDFSL